MYVTHKRAGVLAPHLLRSFLDKRAWPRAPVLVHALRGTGERHVKDGAGHVTGALPALIGLALRRSGGLLLALPGGRHRVVFGDVPRGVPCTLAYISSLI